MVIHFAVISGRYAISDMNATALSPIFGFLKVPKHSGFMEHGQMDRQELKDTYWPWGAGMFVTSLGPRTSDGSERG